MKIKLIITDIDGVWTDGGMYYTESGDEFKKFNTSDSVGVLLAKTAGIPIYIITGENSQSVYRRAKKLNIQVHLGVKDKLKLVNQIISDLDISIEEVAFIGDEINDHALLKAVGFSSCPQSAPSYTKEIVDYIVPTNGGMGAFRDFIIEILKRQGEFNQHFNQIVSS